MKQPALFDASRTQPQRCQVRGCPATRLPGQDRVITCMFDLNTEPARGKRPKQCLNVHRPEFSDIGF